MQLGNFSVSLSVKDITKSKQFYETLGFQALEGCGSVADKWLIMQHESATIGLFQDMFEGNQMTFNPSNVREIEKNLVAGGVKMDVATTGDEGPAHCIFNDPDGNRIMLDQW